MGVFTGVVAGLFIGYILGLFTVAVCMDDETETAYKQGYIDGFNDNPMKE